MSIVSNTGPLIALDKDELITTAAELAEEE